MSAPVAASMSAAIAGRFDGIDQGVAFGWGLAPRELQSKLGIEPLEGNTVVAAGIADRLHQALRKKRIGDGQYGFAIALPPTLADGSAHTLRARVAQSKIWLQGVHGIGEDASSGGAIEGVSAGVVFGWLASASKPAPQLAISVDGAQVAKVAASAPRPDVCNWGGIAVDMALRGMRNVHAFDVRWENVICARRLGKYSGAHNLDVSKGDVYQLKKRRNSFDVVFNLGVFYYINDPLKLARITYDLTRDIAVFDTIAHKEPYAGYVQEIHTEDDSRRSAMGAERIERASHLPWHDRSDPLCGIPADFRSGAALCEAGARACAQHLYSRPAPDFHRDQEPWARFDLTDGSGCLPINCAGAGFHIGTEGWEKKVASSQ